MILSVKNLLKKYDKKVAIDNIDLDFKIGVNGLLGVNGAGKSTLIKMLVTVLKPTSGEIMLNGNNIISLEKKYRNMLGFLPQEFQGYEEFTANDLMFYIGKLKGMSDKDIKISTKDLFEKFSLTEVKNKKIKTFSGGMKRRLGIAQAIINNPKILILDEPTAGLDPIERIKFKNLLETISSDKIIILSTHIVSDIESIAHNVILLKNGNVILTGKKEEIINNYRGKVWEINISNEEIDFMSNFEPVNNYKTEDDGSITFRVIADKKPHPNAHLIEADLENIFLF